MNYTEKLKLKKPSDIDFARIDDHNDNMDQIDKAFADSEKTSDEVSKELSKMNRKLTLTFTAAGWSDTAPFTQSVTAAEVTATDRPERWFDYPASAGEDFDYDKYSEETSYVTYCETGAGTIKAVCKKDKPTMDIVIVFKGY